MISLLHQRHERRTMYCRTLTGSTSKYHSRSDSTQRPSDEEPDRVVYQGLYEREQAE